MNPQEKENRAENRDDNRKEREKDKADKPSRLGKEAKIGAAVILLLLIGLGAVLVVRLRGSNDDKKQTPVTEQKNDKNKSLAAKDDPLFRDAKSKPFGNRSTTVVTPAQPPALPDASSDPWKTPYRSDTKKTGGRYSSPGAPPSFATDVPEPPKPPKTSRYGDPVVGKTSDVSDDGVGRYHAPKNELRPDSFDTKKSSRTSRLDSDGSTLSRDEFDRSESSGYRTPPRSDDRSAALLPPTPSRDSSSYRELSRRSRSTSDISRADDDFPRSPAGSSYDRTGSRSYGSSSVASRSAPRSDGKYKIQLNDSYYKISQTVYGSGMFYKALAEHNRGKFAIEDRLQPGELISTPPAEELQRLYPDLCPKADRLATSQSRMQNVSTTSSYNRGRTYTVAEGDTLFNIARYELGKASRWAEIYELNRDVLGKDINYLTPGMKLVLPDGEKPDVLTKRPGETYR